MDNINNFFYCIKDHNSSDDPNSNDLPNSEYWTQDFWWAPEKNQATSAEFSVVNFGESESFKSRRKIEANTAMFPLEYTFEKLTTKRIKAMLHFLEMKAGFRRFKHKTAKIYNRPKVFICRFWSHTWESSDNHTLQVKFEEDPIGTFPPRIAQYAETLDSFGFDAQGSEVKRVQGDIPSEWLKNESLLYTIKIGNACRTIGSSAFLGSSANGMINLNKVENIGASAFTDCLNLTGTAFGRTLTNIGDFAFSDCKNIRGGLDFPNVLESIGQNAFLGCSSLNGSLKLNNKINSLGVGAFRDCTKLISPIDSDGLAMPDELDAVPAYAFYGCSSLDGDLNLHSGVNSLGDYAFYDCRRLSNIYFESQSLSVIPPNSIAKCYNVREIEIRSLTSPIISPITPTHLYHTFYDLAIRGSLKRIYVPKNGVGYDDVLWSTLTQTANVNIIRIEFE